MKLGDVLRKERERKKLSLESVAANLGLSIDAYQELEGGTSPIEEWGMKLARIAIKLFAPTSRLISETGKSAAARPDDGQCGKLIKASREGKAIDLEEFAKRVEMPVEELTDIEAGKTPLETYAPLLLHFSELIEQPIFNLFYPCGLPLDKLEDYP